MEADKSTSGSEEEEPTGPKDSTMKFAVLLRKGKKEQVCINAVLLFYII